MNNDLKFDALRIQCQVIMNNAEFVLQQCEERGATNEQWFLDFLDQLNKLSVKF